MDKADVIRPEWINQFNFDPITPLRESNQPAVWHFAQKDLLGESAEDIREVWKLPEVQKLVKTQNSDGSWRSKSPSIQKNPAQNYHLFEMFKHTNILTNVYGMTRDHPCIKKAMEYLFSRQTEEGDIRGIIGEQYAPYYNGLIVANLNRAGYVNDPRVERVFEWLLTMRQNDGGWIIGSPGCLGSYSAEERYALTTQFVGTRRDFDRNKPSGHAGTGMVIRAFATHPHHRTSVHARRAAELLADSLFERNTNASYRHPDNWLRFKYPFWWTDLVSALDSLSRIGISRHHPKIERALIWLVDNQLPTGLWRHSYSKIHNYRENDATRVAQLWISLAILRVCKAFGSDKP